MAEVSSASGESRVPQMGLVLVSVALLVAPLAIGGVHLPVRLVLSTLLLLSLAVVVVSRWRTGIRLELGPFGLGLSLLLAWSFLQWLPLPAGLVSLMVPESAESRTIAATILETEALSWHSLSQDGSRTAMSWLTLLSYWIVFVLSRHSGRWGWGSRTPLLWIFSAVVLVFLVGLVHSVLDLKTELYGFYSAGYRRWAAPFVTSFVNPNHAPSCMLLGTGTGIALWFRIRNDPRRWIVLVTVIALAVGAMSTGSRAAILLLPTLFVMIAITTMAMGSPDVSRHHLARATLGALGVALVGMALLVTPRWLESLQTQMTTTSLFIEANFHGRWYLGWEAAKRYLWFGSGLGTFGVISPALGGAMVTGLMDHAHNLFLQFVCDWGLPVSLVAGSLMLYGVVSSTWKKRADPDALVIALSILVLVVHNMVEFSLYIPGVGLLAMAALGWLVADDGREKGGGEEREPGERTEAWWKRSVLVASPTLILILSGCLVLTAWHAVAQSPERLGQQARAQLDSDAEERLSIESMIMEHPSDFYLFGVGSALAWQLEESERAWALMNRAVDLAPFDGRTRLARARLYVADGRESEAVPDLVFLTEHGKEKQAFKEVLRWPSATSILERLLSHDDALVLDLVSVLRAHGDPKDVRRVLEWGMERFPESIELAEALAEHVMWTPGHTEELDALATKILAGGVDNRGSEVSVHRRRTGYLLQGFVHSRRGMHLEAYHLFLEAAAQDPAQESQPLVLAAGALVNLNSDVSRLRKLLKRLRPHLEDNPNFKDDYHKLLSVQHEREGDVRLAIQEMHKAVLFAPKHPQYQVRLANLYDSIGQSVASDKHMKRYEAFKVGQPAP